VIIDDYPRYVEPLRSLFLGAGTNLHLIITSRTPAHLTHREQLLNALDGVALIEIRADALTAVELQSLDTILSGAGLLGNAASWNQKRRVEELYKRRGEAEFGSILLWLFEAPHVRRKLLELFREIKKGEMRKES
jgi:hypothetical protein